MSNSTFSLLHAQLLVVFCACLVHLANSLNLKLTAKEEIKLHDLYNRYNKPASLEIKTVYGDTYSCVDFYKQPAFDHPSMKNHSYHHEMNHGTNYDSQESSLFKGLWANGEGCPTGTVPIRKYTKEQFIRTYKLFQKLYPTDGPLPGRYRSSVHTKNGPHAFYGGSASINFYNYPVDKSQYTSAYLIIRAVNDQFQFGWTINPAMYGDGQTRLFLSTKVENTTCFNLMCGGFVQTNKNIPLDAAISPPTQRGGANASEIKPTITKDPSSNLWKLSGANKIEVGYWPNEVLKGLQGPAEYLEWGGEVYNPNGLNGPGMGSGFFPTGDANFDGYVRQLYKYDQSGKIDDIASDETESYADNSDYYKIQDGGYVNFGLGHIAYYGGPGKQN